MESIRRYLREARKLDAEQFAKLFPHCALVVEPHAESVGEGFNTLSPTSSSGTVQSLAVAPIRKRHGANSFANMVTIGRAANNDISLRAAGISKFHAYVMVGPGGSCDLTDAKSTFGTWVGERQVTPTDGKVELTSGDVLKLGELKATFYTPGGLFEYLMNAKDLVS